MKPPRAVFRSLRSRNFRIWSAGALVSNLGGCMQRVAQDWLMLTGLTHHDARAVAAVVALQFAPQVLLLPWTGWAADHLDRRRLLPFAAVGSAPRNTTLGEGRALRCRRGARFRSPTRARR